MELGDHSLTIALFDQFPIRRTWHNEEWWYSIIDCLVPLTGSTNPNRYWTDLAKKLKIEMDDTYDGMVLDLKMPTATGRMRATACANTTGILRIIQSVPSPNAEPLKQWLASIGTWALERDVEEKALRSEYRLRFHQFDMILHEVVGFRGVSSPEQHQRLTDANYAGLYATSGEEAVRRKKQMAFSGKTEDFMGPDELAANIFQRSQIRQAVERENLQGIEQIAPRAEDVGVQIRLTIERIGGTMPEDFPRYRLISRGEWVPEDQLSLLDWDNPNEDTDETDPPIPIIEIEKSK